MATRTRQVVLLGRSGLQCSQSVGSTVCCRIDTANGRQRPDPPAAAAVVAGRGPQFKNPSNLFLTNAREWRTAAPHRPTPQHRAYSTKDTGAKAASADVAAGGSSDDAPQSLVDRVVKGLGWLGGFYSRRQVIMRSARTMYMGCAEQAAKDNIYVICKLPDTFQSWFLVQQLHVWLCLVRLKAEGSDGKYYHKMMVKYFWEDVENRMKLMKMDDRNLQAENSRELLSMFYGLVFAYDEGIAGDDAVLAAAVWRNLFHDSKATATAQDLAVIVDYIRREVHSLDTLDGVELIENGEIEFGKEPEVPKAK